MQALINKFSCANEVYKIAIIRWRIAVVSESTDHSSRPSQTQPSEIVSSPRLRQSNDGGHRLLWHRSLLTANLVSNQSDWLPKVIPLT